MNRIHIISVGLIVAAAFIGLVYLALRLAQVAEPSAAAVHGFTGRRLWATATVGLAIVSAVLACRGWFRPAGNFGSVLGRRATILMGTIAALSGGLVLVVADSGPGSGNGVVGGAAALVLGLFAVALAVCNTRRVCTPGTTRRGAEASSPSASAGSSAGVSH